MRVCLLAGLFVMFWSLSAPAKLTGDDRPEASQERRSGEKNAVLRCSESLPVDLYMKCLEREGIIPRLGQRRSLSKKQLAAATQCDETAADADFNRCVGSYFRTSVRAKASRDCGLYVKEQDVLDCIRGLPVQSAEWHRTQTPPGTGPGSR